MATSERFVVFGNTDVLMELRGSGGPEAVDAGSKLSFEPAKQAIEAIVTELGDAIRKARPEEASVAVGFSFTAKSGKLTALVVEGGAGATLTVTLTWKSEKPEVK